MDDIAKQAWVQYGALGLLIFGLIWDRFKLQKRISTLEGRDEGRSERVLKALEGANSATVTQNELIRDMRATLVNLGQSMLSLDRLRS